MRVTIKVEQTHIDEGCRGSPWECPDALACMEQLKVKEVSITERHAAICEGGNDTHIARLPKQETERISKYDDSGWMEPHSFELEFKDVRSKGQD